MERHLIVLDILHEQGHGPDADFQRIAKRIGRLIDELAYERDVALRMALHRKSVAKMFGDEQGLLDAIRDQKAVYFAEADQREAGSNEPERRS